MNKDLEIKSLQNSKTKKDRLFRRSLHSKNYALIIFSLLFLRLEPFSHLQ